MRGKRLLIPILLILILLLGTFLRFYKLGADGYGNMYYAATVKSMLTSWHNFFYAAYEPGGSVSVDKPPLGFWLQAISAGILGINGFALALPQALAGMLSIVVVYYLIKRPFGEPAGLVAAFFLAITPITVVTERNNTIDGTLVLVLLLAIWALIRSIRKGSFPYLLICLILVGIGFNIKMLQAYMILPAVYLTYLIAARQKWWMRILHLAGATVLLVVVSLSWVIAFDLTPASERPYAGSSTENSMLELVVGHNGLARLEKLRPFSGLQGALYPPPAGTNPQNPIQGGNLPNRPRSGIQPLPGGQLPPYGNPAQPPSGAAQTSIRQNEVGAAGFLRLFSNPLDDEASWLLILALLTIPLTGAMVTWYRPLDDKWTSWLVWTLWLIPMLLFFSFTTGLWHTYYLIMLGPGIAALSGMSVWSIEQLYQRNRLAGWLATLLLTGGTLAYEIILLNRYLPSAAWVIELAVLLALTGLILAACRPAALRPLAVVCLAISLALPPLAWSVVSVTNPLPDSNLPHAGPGDVKNNNAAHVGDLNPFQAAVLQITLANTDPDTYLLAGLSANQTAAYILATGRPVLALGGFSGNDNIFTLDELRAKIDSGELRYVLVSQELSKQYAEFSKYVGNTCRIVPLPGMRPQGQVQQPLPAGQQGTLFECGG
jgi:4-amino-4-deoxy-L-arabinose transferase-like glycosyltransferase